ncbi:hypothetical protein DSN97_00430 [Deferribacteraceae bacterium V6Fe1]|nr:hypothetical protein DSN97_00430 [Deferribacteraceae bacterium V6Fe1]
MKPISKELKKIVIFTAVILIISIGYYLYALFFYAPLKESKTFLTKIGETFGAIGLWLILFIYARTLIKLLLGKGAVAKRLLPEYSSPVDATQFKKLIHFLDRTHIYFGVSALAAISLHAVLMGIPMRILFFPAVLVLIAWQGLFGMFIAFRYTPSELKKLSYLVHAQLFTGIMIGIFALLGHILVGN